MRRALATLLLSLAACGADERPALTTGAETPEPTPASEPEARGQDVERPADPAVSALADASRYAWHEPIVAPHACSDGPDGAARTSIPGGDLGALVVASATLEPSRGLSLSPDELDALIESFATRFERIELHGEPAMLSPDSDAASFTCDHVRLLLGHPEEYGVREGLVRALLDALARREASHPGTIRWSSDTPEAREVIVVDVERTPGATPPTYVARTDDSMRVWVFVPESAALHAHVVRWLDAFAPTDDAERRAVSLAALVTRQTRATLRHLAREMPVYEARFTRDDPARAPAVSGPVASMGCRTY